MSANIQWSENPLYPVGIEPIRQRIIKMAGMPLTRICPPPITFAQFLSLRPAVNLQCCKWMTRRNRHQCRHVDGLKSAVDDAGLSGDGVCFVKIEQNRDRGIIHLLSSQRAIGLPGRRATNVVEDRFLDTVFADVGNLVLSREPLTDRCFAGGRATLLENDRVLQHHAILSG